MKQSLVLFFCLIPISLHAGLDLKNAQQMVEIFIKPNIINPYLQHHYLGTSSSGDLHEYEKKDLLYLDSEKLKNWLSTKECLYHPLSEPLDDPVKTYIVQKVKSVQNTLALCKTYVKDRMILNTGVALLGAGGYIAWTTGLSNNHLFGTFGSIASILASLACLHRISQMKEINTFSEHYKDIVEHGIKPCLNINDLDFATIEP